MSSYQLSALSEVSIFLFIPIVVSIVYWSSSASLKTGKRFISSVHGFVFVIASLFAVFISKYTEMGDGGFVFYVFLFIIIVGVISIVYSLLYYPNSKLVHLLHVPNIVCAFLILFIGGMTIAHDWV